MATPDGFLSGRRTPSAIKPTATILVLLVAGLGLLSACGGSPEPQLSIETQLEAVSGRDLSPTEVARQIEIADTLCGMNDDVLAAIWGQLEDSQLAFQDYVFGSHCPDRSVTYGLATGRTLTPEARVAAAEEQSDNPTSSTVQLPDPASPPRSSADDSPATSTGPSISISTEDED